MGLSDVGKAAAVVRDGAHKALGGHNGSGLKYQTVEITGRCGVPNNLSTGGNANWSYTTLEARAPAGYIVTGGGWECPDMNDRDFAYRSRPTPEGKGWMVSMAALERGGNPNNYPEFTVYAVCIADDA